MTQSAERLAFTFAEYLAREEASETKHEFLRGEIFDMAGGTPEHGRLSANVIAELRAALRGRNCAVYTSDVRVRAIATGLATYPDVTVVCGSLQVDPEDKNSITNPVVVVEVLSDSTEAYDRGEKFAHYRRIPSLREYVLVSQREPRIELYRRNEDGTWTLWDVAAPDVVKLSSIACELSVAEVFQSGLEAAS